MRYISSLPRRINQAVSIISASLLGIFVFMACRYPLPSYASFANIKEKAKRSNKWKYNKVNPSPMLRTFNRDANSASLYVAILDLDYAPQRYHCMMKDIWIDKILSSPLIDGVEFYSMNSWRNPLCNLTSITCDPPPFNVVNPSSWLIHKTLRLFLERSLSNWLFISTGPTYIKAEQFVSYFEMIAKSKAGRNGVYAIGNCIEPRYFFRMHTLEGGVLITRDTVSKMLELTDKWDISDRIGISADEILGQVLDQVGVFVPFHDTSMFIGREWRNISSFDDLLRKDFNNLKECHIPEQYLIDRAGEIGVCSRAITKFSDIIVWNGADDNNKEWFLQNAGKMLSDLPDYVGYYWDLTKPMLCRIGGHN